MDGVPQVDAAGRRMTLLRGCAERQSSTPVARSPRRGRLHYCVFVRRLLYTAAAAAAAASLASCRGRPQVINIRGSAGSAAGRHAPLASSDAAAANVGVVAGGRAPRRPRAAEWNSSPPPHRLQRLPEIR